MLTARPQGGPELDETPGPPASRGLVPRQPSAAPPEPVDPRLADAPAGPPRPATAPARSVVVLASAAAARLRAAGRHGGRTTGRIAIVTAAASVACAGALSRLWPAWRAQEAPAHLLAVLPAAVLLLLLRSRPEPDEPDIHDRQIDYLVGIPLLGTAVFVLTAMPARMGDRFWTAHGDLLVLPPLLAGAIALVFGTRTLWRLRGPLLLLAAALAPLPARVAQAPARAVLTVADGPLRALTEGHLVASVEPAGGPALPPQAGTSDGSLVSAAGALTGLAGVSAALVVAVLLGAGLRRRRSGPAAGTGAALVLVVWTVLTGARVTAGLVAVRTEAPGAARLLLGADGDLVTMALLFIVITAGLLVPTGSGHVRADAVPVVRREAVPRSRWSLALVVSVGLVLAALGGLLVPATVGP